MSVFCFDARLQVKPTIPVRNALMAKGHIGVKSIT